MDTILYLHYAQYVRKKKQISPSCTIATLCIHDPSFCLSQVKDTLRGALPVVVHKVAYLCSVSMYTHTHTHTHSLTHWVLCPSFLKHHFPLTPPTSGGSWTMGWLSGSWVVHFLCSHRCTHCLCVLLPVHSAEHSKFNKQVDNKTVVKPIEEQR